MIKVDKDFLDEYTLEEDQYFLKTDIRKTWDYKAWTYIIETDKPTIGLMSKTNKNGSIPKIFKDFGDKLDIYLHTESYRNGWKLYDSRNTGQGDGISWVILVHPKGFTVEIRASEFVELLMNLKIENGLILNKCFYDAKAKTLLYEK